MHLTTKPEWVFKITAHGADSREEAGEGVVMGDVAVEVVSKAFDGRFTHTKLCQVMTRQEPSLTLMTVGKP